MSHKKQSDFETGCKYKMGHATHGDALNQARKRNPTGSNKHHNPIKAYKCPFCGMWHVGNSGSPKDRKMAKYDKRLRREKLI